MMYQQNKKCASTVNSQNLILSQSTQCSQNNSASDLNNCKILGYLNQNYERTKFIPLESILPIPVLLLQRMMINLCELITELEVRAFPVPEIKLNSILVSQQHFDIGFVYIVAPENQSHPTQQQTFIELQNLMRQLLFPKSMIKNAKTVTELEEHCWQQLIRDQKLKFDIGKFDKFINYINNQLGLKEQQERHYLHEQILVLSAGGHKFIEAQESEKIAIKYQKDADASYQRREIEILEKLNSEYTSKLYCYFRLQGITVMVLKYHDLTLKEVSDNLAQLAKSEPKEDIAEIYLSLFKLIINSVSHLHVVDGVIHRDLKPENIMFDFPSPPKILTDYKTAKCIIIDYDRSKCIEDNLISNYSGTPKYIPPEGVLETYSSSYDIYQLGIIFMFAIYKFGKFKKNYTMRPLSEQQFNDMIGEISQSEKRVDFRDDVIGIIKSMVRYDPTKRPTIDVVIAQLNAI